MAENKPKFYRFPKTLHLEGSDIVDDDQFVSFLSLKSLIHQKTKLIIQEKVDGANVGIHFEEEWEPIMQKRSDLIQTKEKSQYDVFKNWVYENLETLWELLSNKYCLFGEWLWCKHSIYYNSLPNFFIGFDIMEKQSNKFLSTGRIKELVGNKLSLVPIVAETSALILAEDNAASQLQAFIQKSKFGDEISEGIYLRLETEDYLIDRFKFRRHTFTPGRENFSHAIEKNQLSSKE